jgi:hypothetical protein
MAPGRSGRTRLGGSVPRRAIDLEPYARPAVGAPPAIGERVDEEQAAPGDLVGRRALGPLSDTSTRSALGDSATSNPIQSPSPLPPCRTLFVTSSPASSRAVWATGASRLPGGSASTAALRAGARDPGPGRRAP